MPWPFRARLTLVGSPVLLQSAGWAAWDDLIRVQQLEDRAFWPSFPSASRQVQAPAHCPWAASSRARSAGPVSHRGTCFVSSMLGTEQGAAQKHVHLAESQGSCLQCLESS